MSDLSLFPLRLKEARKNEDMSQAELSRRTGIAPATLSSYESTDNFKKPTIDKVFAIAKALQISMDWLCGLSDMPSIESEPQQVSIDVAILLRAIAEFTVNHNSDTITITSLSAYLSEGDREYFAENYKVGSPIILSDRISIFLENLIQFRALRDNGTFTDDLFDMCVEQLILKTSKEILLDESSKSETGADRTTASSNEKPPQ